MSNIRNVHSKIAMIRKLKKLDPQTVADRIPLSLKAYQRLEKGETKCDMERLEQVAKALEVDPDLLLHFDEQMVFNNSTNHGITNTGDVHINTPIKIYEERIAELKERNAELKEQISDLKKRLTQFE